MENQTQEQKKSSTWKRYYLLPMSFMILVIFGLAYYLYLTDKEKDQANADLSKEMLVNSTCSFKRDSLLKEVKQLSIYKSLTKAMVHRDEATVLLKHKVGDFVYLKIDSSRVIISDIIIGGAQYEYYIKYKVLYKDKTTEDIAPELIY